MTTMRVVGECFFWYWLTRVFPDKFHRAVKRLCVCVVQRAQYLPLGVSSLKMLFSTVVQMYHCNFDVILICIYLSVCIM